MFKIAVCDDDITFLNEAKLMIYKWADERDVDIFIESFDNGDALLDHKKKKTYDLIVLDIMMPLLNGMDAAKEIRKDDITTKIVFLTSSPEFALESYDVKASGYLLKPVNYTKLVDTLDDCIQQLRTEPDNIVVKTLAGYQKVYLENIEAVEAQNRNVKFVLKNGEEFEVLGAFSNYLELLPLEKGFFKCHRSYIVSIVNVDQFNSTNIVTKSGMTVPIARGFAKPFKEAYFDFMFKSGKG